MNTDLKNLGTKKLQNHFNNGYNEAKKRGYNVNDSTKIAFNYARSQQVDEIVQGKKSFALSSSNFSGNVIDVLIGYPGEDTESQYGGLSLDSNGWNNIPSNSMTFDLNHFNFDSIKGVKNNLEEKWHNFGIKIDDWYKDEEGLKAKAYIPDSDLGNEFKEQYKQGKFGVSIEYEGVKEGNSVKDWNITGGTFHTDPSYSNTKPKGL